MTVHYHTNKRGDSLIQLVLSLDYELFGNGSGDVRRDMIEPTRRLLSLCDRHGAKLSIFLEVGEYWAMKEAEAAGSLRLGYSPTREIERQLQEAVRRGHDVQLHLHPWWIGASFENGRWRLHPEYRCVTDLPNGLGAEGDVYSVVGVLDKGKCTLEEMIRPVCPDYQCQVYRAAMFWGQPSTDLIAGSRRAGLVADSSVIAGLQETHPVPTDYRHAPSAWGAWWTNADDIAASGSPGEGVIELPVYSRMLPYIYNFKGTKLATTLKRRKVERDNLHGHGMMDARKSTESTGGVLKKLFTVQPQKYDLCKMSAADMTAWLKHLIRDGRTRQAHRDAPVVMLGHSKDFWNDRNVNAFLERIVTEHREEVRFDTLAAVTRRIMNESELSFKNGNMLKSSSPAETS